MNNNVLIKSLALVFLGFCISLPSFAIPVTSKTKLCKPLINKNQKVPKPALRGMPEKVHKKVTKALELLADERYNEGIAALKRVEEKSSDNFVKSVISMNIASGYAQQNKYKQALPYFKKALKLGEGSLDHDRVQGLRLNVASLMYSVGNKKEALRLMNQWMKKSIKHDPKAYVLLSVMYAEEGRYKDSLCPAYFAVKYQKKPNAQYYNLLLVSHYEQKDRIGSAAVLKKMVELFPSENSYWRQLSTLYLNLDKTKDSLALMEMLYLKGGFDKESDYKTLSSLFAFEDIPYHSARVLEEGMSKGIVESNEKNWKAIAVNYRVSKEIDKAIAAYGKTAELAKNGEVYLTQADLYFEQEKWRDSIRSLDKALKKGVEDTGRVYFTKGSAQASLGQCKSAVASLQSATKYKKWRQRANAWISFVKDKEKRDKC